MVDDNDNYKFSPPPRSDLAQPFMVFGILFLILILVAFWFVWFECRIQVDKGELVPLLKKSGNNMTNDMVLAPSEEYRGPQIGFLREGRHFRNPWYYEWPKKMKAIEVEPGKVMVLVRKYGDSIPPDQIVALKDNEKGILRGAMTPGRYYLSE